MQIHHWGCRTRRCLTIFRSDKRFGWYSCQSDQDVKNYHCRCWFSPLCILELPYKNVISFGVGQLKVGYRHLPVLNNLHSWLNTVIVEGYRQTLLDIPIKKDVSNRSIQLITIVKKILYFFHAVRPIMIQDEELRQSSWEFSVQEIVLLMQETIYVLHVARR